MSASDDFLNLFDEKGRYRNGDRAVDVVFLTRDGKRHQGRLHFFNGLCVRVEMQDSGDWSYPDNSPLNEIRLLLNFDGQQPLLIAINEGRVVGQASSQRPSTKEEFLSNFRVARNLFNHAHVDADSPSVDTQAVAMTIARAAIWLTPKSVAGFNPVDFPELGPQGLRALQVAVGKFLDIAKTVPPNKPATDDQYRIAAAAFTDMLEILAPYLPVAEEARRIEKVLQGVGFPSWVVNWDFELGSDSEGASAVWVNVFADEERAPLKQAGKFASELTTKIRMAFAASGIDRGPYIRMRTASEHKAQV